MNVIGTIPGIPTVQLATIAGVTTAATAAGPATMCGGRRRRRTAERGNASGDGGLRVADR